MTQLAVTREVHRLDASGIPLGRLATQIATLLRGKHKPTFAPHIDAGDEVIVINAQKIKLTGNKLEQKEYHWHTGYLGHLKTRNARHFMENDPGELIVRAVTGMLPRNRLRPNFLKRLTIYTGNAPEDKGVDNG